MTKTKKIIIGGLVIIVLGALVLWFLGNRNSGDPNVQTSGFSIKNFFPFGNAPGDDSSTDGDGNFGGSSTSTNSSNENNNSSVITTVPIKKLRKLSDKPVAGSVIFNSSTKGSTTSIVRFVEKATGNVYEARSDSSQIKRLSNETIPKIMRGFWLWDGSGFLAQTVDDNETIYTSFIRLKPIASSSPDSLISYEPVISKLPTGIQEIAVSPDNKKIFYYTADAIARGYTSNPDGTSQNLAFANYLTEWTVDWFGASSILIASKASFASESHGFVLNPNKKTLTKSYSDIVGGSALARPDGKYILLSNGGETPNLLLENAADTSFTSVNVRTLSEKCSWSKADIKFIYCGVPKSISDTSWPDSWYQGIVSTNDLIEKINVFDLYNYVLIDPEADSGEKIDVENLQSSRDGQYLIFTNKTDQSLWMLDTR